MRFVVLLILAVLPLFATSQTWKRKPKHSMGRGTLFISWGYNTTGFSKSTLNMQGPGYDFSLSGVKASDDDFELLPTQNYGAQFNARVGYYIRNYFALSLGWDRTHYILNDKSSALLSGTVNPGVDVSGNWTGSYNNESVTTDQSIFHYSNTLNLLNLEAMRTDQWFRIGENFGLSTNFGLALGAVMTRNDYLFSGQQDLGSTSLSGFLVSGQAGLRFEFFRHLFLQPTLRAGFIQQMNVNTRISDPNSLAKQNFAFTMFDVSLGYLFYIRPTNDCQSCPVW